MKLSQSPPLIVAFSLGLCSLSNGYELHEWGTFTTVSGSDGKLLTGLQVEEEHLPPFVYSHLGMETSATRYLIYPPAQTRRNKNQLSVVLDEHNVLQALAGFKGMPKALLRNVTVKMETPVIYFYGDDTPKVNVKVGFNGGTISQWYPQRKSGDTPNLVKKGEYQMSDKLKTIAENKEMIALSKPLDFSKHYSGAIEWDVEIIPSSEADPAFTFKPNESTTWIYPRVPDANMLKVGGEYEDYLFYRGLGNFELPVSFSVDASETVVVTNNNKSEAIPFAFAFENVAGKFRYKALGQIEAGKVAKVAESEWVRPEAHLQQVEVFREMRKGLVAEGLTEHEANGMIKTWWKSYFNKSGLRVFWIVPQSNLEQILPLQVSPAPEKQVRVLVGRADILRPNLEQEMIAKLGTHEFRKFQNDRFFMSYKNRLEQLVKKPVFQRFDEKNLSGLMLQVLARKGTSHLGEGFYLSEGNEVKLQHLGVSGEWKILSEDTLQIGDHVFQLEERTGLLTAEAKDDPLYDSYEIQLPRVLN